MNSLVDVAIQTEQNDDVENIEPQFIPLLDFEDDYEILNQYPFTIRRTRDQYVLKESYSNGYVVVTLNGIQQYKHILIAKQFIPNPNNLPYVDHISRDRSDYHLENLRFVTSSQNLRNKSSHKGVEYEYVKSIPEDAIEITDYNQHTFEESEYFFYDDIFYEYNGIEYRILHINRNKSGNLFVSLQNDEGKQVSVYYSKFKRLYRIPFD